MSSEERLAVVREILEAKGYRLDRIRSSHHLFTKPGCDHVNIPVHGGKVKPYYVKQAQKAP